VVVCVRGNKVCGNKVCGNKVCGNENNMYIYIYIMSEQQLWEWEFFQQHMDAIDAAAVARAAMEAVKRNVTNLISEAPAQLALVKEKVDGAGESSFSTLLFSIFAFVVFAAILNSPSRRGGRAATAPDSMLEQSFGKDSSKLPQMTTDNVEKMINDYASKNKDAFIKLIEESMNQAIELDKTGKFKRKDPTVWMKDPETRTLLIGAVKAAAAVMKGGKRKSKKSRKAKKSKKSRKSRKSKRRRR
jgi:polyhydroxyalkanoate synthesis regulator protein